jgi:hypothetical protein
MPSTASTMHFTRWRDLFMSAARQRDLARRTMDTHSLPERERNAARILHGQAMDQLALVAAGQGEPVQ